MLPSFLVLALLAWAGLFLLVAPRLPDTDQLFADSGQRQVTLLASDGSVLDERGAAGNRLVALEEHAPQLIQAVIATEDHRFYGHFGIDPIGLGRAALANLREGGVVAGGSTITQQLAKNLFLTPERSLTRKLEELVFAIWLEARLTKDQILTLYLNRVYLGAGTYGMDAAAQRYFGKPAKEVSLAEAAMLAGLLKAPTTYAPTNHLDRARGRATVVLGRMTAEGFITAEQELAARAKPARLAPETKTDLAGHFLDWVLDDLTTHLGKVGRDLVVTTTLDRQLQTHAETLLRDTLAGEGTRLAVGEGAIVVIDGSGAIRAMVGGESYRSHRLNRAAGTRRQPGSAFKPFLYLTALQAGMTPESMIDDKPVAIDGWKPENFDGKHRGRVSLAEAFAFSLNTAAARLIQQVTPAKVVATAHRLGIASTLQPVPSLALGTSEVSLLELTAAYGPIATGGIRRPPFAVTEVRDDRGRVLYRYSATETRVIEPRIAGQMQQLLAGAVERGTGRAARRPDRQAAGKTGTTQDNRDAWFVGFADEVTAGVWLGNDDNSPMRSVTGSGLPAKLWREVMTTVPKSRPPLVATASPEPERILPPIVREAAENGLALLLDWIEQKFGTPQ